MRSRRSRTSPGISSSTLPSIPAGGRHPRRVVCSSGSDVLDFGGYRLERLKYTEEECRDRDYNYSAALKVKVRLIIKETGEIKEQEVFMGDFPLMTARGTFIINGAERVVVSQLVRSPGAYY